jgi:hypothetical protein
MVRWGQDDGVLVLRRESRSTKYPGLCLDPRWIVWNFNSGAAAINLAVHFGAARIVLLGFDMHFDEKGRGNYHDRYGRGRGAKKAFDLFLGVFPAIAEDCERAGVEVINATPGSALKVWPVVEPDLVVPGLRREEVFEHAES